MCLLVLGISFLSKGPFISIVSFLFFPLNHQASGGCGPPAYCRPGSRSIKLVSISMFRVGSSFWRWFSSSLPPHAATWHSSLGRFLMISDVGYLPLLKFLESSVPWLRCRQAGFMGKLPCTSTGPASQKGLSLGVEYSIITVLTFLII